MTRFAPLWQQNGSYPAEVDRMLLSSLWPVSTMQGGAVTVATGTMNVNVAAGTAAVALQSHQTALCRWDATESVAVGTAPASGNSRIDLIVLQVRDAVLDSGGNNDFIFQAITGTATTGTPVAPSTPPNSLILYQVLVAGGAANLNGAVLTDVRPLGPIALGNAQAAYPPVAANSALITKTDANGEVWVAKGGVNGGAWRKARDVLRARWCRSAAWSVSTTASVPYDFKIFDAYGLFVGSSFVIPATGMYLVSATSLLTGGANVQLDMQIVQGAGSVYNTKAVLTVGFYAGIQANDVCTFNAGDLIAIQLGCAQVVSLAGGAPYNIASLTYLGTG